MTDDTLPGGLRLRAAREADVEQVAALLADRGEPADADDFGLVVADPDAGLEAVAVVVDGDRVVSTATLLDETLRVRHPAGTMELAAGQVELVATERAYEGRGLVRALMAWAHDRSARRGHDLQVMVGIPYFYRRFGYEYSIDLAPALPVAGSPPERPSSGRLRRAEPGDADALRRLQDAAQAAADVTLPRSAAVWRWVLPGTGTTTWVFERGDGVVATCRIPNGRDELVLAEVAAVDDAAAGALVGAVAAEHPEAELSVVDRPGPAAGQRWSGSLVGGDGLCEQYYVRLAEPAAVLDRFRPVFAARLAAAGVDRSGRDVLVSTFGHHHRLAVGDDGSFGPVRSGGQLQAPGAVAGCGVAPDALGALLFGSLGMHGLCRRRPDVYPGADAELYETLFPPLRADVLTWYLPY